MGNQVEVVTPHWKGGINQHFLVYRQINMIVLGASPPLKKRDENDQDIVHPGEGGTLDDGANDQILDGNPWDDDESSSNCTYCLINTTYPDIETHRPSSLCYHYHCHRNYLALKRNKPYIS